MIRKNLVTLILLAMAGVAHGADEKSKVDVQVRIVEVGPVSWREVVFAKGIATQILDSAGVRLQWATASSRGTESRTGGCVDNRAVKAIDLRFIYTTPKERQPRALAEAIPFAKDGTRITIFFDRVSEVMALSPQFGAHILGHVLAHEIGHVLAGENSHAESGLMKAQWSHEEFRWMGVKNLGFTPSYATMIRSNLSLACSPVIEMPLVAVANQ